MHEILLLAVSCCLDSVALFTDDLSYSTITNNKQPCLKYYNVSIVHALHASDDEYICWMGNESMP